jgi:E3 ubiquitin-protein ligase HERC2
MKEVHTLSVVVAGVLMGIAIRTGSPLSLNLAEPVWKQLAGMVLTPADLTEVDRDYVPGMLCIVYQLQTHSSQILMAPTYITL